MTTCSCRVETFEVFYYKKFDFSIEFVISGLHIQYLDSRVGMNIYMDFGVWTKVKRVWKQNLTFFINWACHIILLNLGKAGLHGSTIFSHISRISTWVTYSDAPLIWLISEKTWGFWRIISVKWIKKLKIKVGAIIVLLFVKIISFSIWLSHKIMYIKDREFFVSRLDSCRWLMSDSSCVRPTCFWTWRQGGKHSLNMGGLDRHTC